jgi:hypothetical protein
LSNNFDLMLPNDPMMLMLKDRFGHRCGNSYRNSSKGNGGTEGKLSHRYGNQTRPNNRH